MTGGPAGGTFAALRSRPFAAFWVATLISNIGTWASTVSVSVLVTESTGQALWAGIAAGAQWAPAALLAPIGGVAADGPRRKVAQLTGFAVQAATALALCVLTWSARPAPATVAVIVLIAGCANAVVRPATQSLLADLVPRDDLVSALALMSAQMSLGRIVGPAFAGLALWIGGDLRGYATAFALNALTFVIVIAVVASIRVPEHARRRTESMWAAALEGLRFSSRDPTLRVVLAYLAAGSILVIPYLGLVSPMALEVLGLSDRATSLLVATQGVGSMVAALSLTRLIGRFGTQRVLGASVTALPVVLILYSQVTGVVTATLALLAAAAVYVAMASTMQTIAQLRTPPAWRGRMLGTFSLIDSGVYVVGLLCQAWLADRIGLRVTTALTASLMLLVVATFRLTRFGDLRAVETASPAISST